MRKITQRGGIRTVTRRSAPRKRAAATSRAQQRSKPKSDSDSDSSRTRTQKTRDTLRKKRQLRESFRTVSKPFTKWRLVCSTVKDWENLAAKFKDSKVRSEKMMYRVLTQDFLPDLPDMVADAVST